MVIQQQTVKHKNPAATNNLEIPLHFSISQSFSACAIVGFHGTKIPAAYGPTRFDPLYWWASIGNQPNMDPFKVTVESLHANRIKEINYEGEESYQE